MIQDIAPSRFSVVYDPVMPSAQSPVVFFIGGSLYMHADASFIRFGETAALLQETEVRFLFTIDETAYFMPRFATLLSDSPNAAAKLAGLIPDAKPYNVRQIRDLADPVSVFAAYTAFHLIEWYNSSRFCGKCGHAMIDGADERKVVCPSCGNIVYPRINPAIIAAVYDHDRLLMTRYAGRAVNWLVLVAGFMEIGESAEDTVRREVLEETGVHVKNIRYFGSQPWGIPGNITLGYTAELDGSDEITVDTGELSEALWVERSQVGERRESLSITQEMIQAFKNGLF